MSAALQRAYDMISDYRATWERVIQGVAPLSELDRFFNVPCFMVSLSGGMTLYETTERVTSFNQTRLDAFRQGKAHGAILRAVDVSSQGAHLTLANVNWELIRVDGSLERAWRHYYTIMDQGTAIAPTIIVSAFQTGS